MVTKAEVQSKFDSGFLKELEINDGFKLVLTETTKCFKSKYTYRL